VRRLPAFSDKGESETLGRKLNKLVARRANREPRDLELGRWLQSLAAGMRETLCRWELLDTRSVAANHRYATIWPNSRPP
jgi:hypothetical protein